MIENQADPNLQRRNNAKDFEYLSTEAPYPL